MSVLEALKPIYSLLPEVRAPEGKQPLNRRLMWTAAVLLLFFLMGNIRLIGLSSQSLGGQLESAQIVLALKIGTLISAGIGPIVLASIILQLLIGGGLIKLDLSNPAEKAQFSGTQKLLAIALSFIEGFFYLAGGLLVAAPGMFWFVLLQMALGSILLLYMDEVVSRYGIGSGIGLFIAGGVAEEVFWRAFSPLDAARNFNLAEASGLVFLLINSIGSSLVTAVTQYFLPIFFTLVVFLVVVYAEGIHVNIPITMGARGSGGRYPVKFLYVSNMPVILAAALFANIQIWATLVQGRVPILENIIGGLAAIVSSPTQLVERLLLEGLSPQIFGQFVQSITTFQFVGLGGEIIHGFLYIIILTLLCVVFGKFWIELGGQGSERVAQQLDRAGMAIPGFRRDPRVIKQVLDRYIPTITILGSAFVGLLAGFADLTGALGTGTGILLTVGIVYRLYEELAKQQLEDMHPMLGRFFGG